MAMFPTHIKTSTIVGIGYGAVALVAYEVPPTTCLVGAGLCAIGGILPDIDSGPGIPLREITTFLASVVPTMLITRLLSYSLTQEMLILVGAILYVAIRFGLSHFLRHYTIHRGMFHSFPTMAIFAELTYLLFYGESAFIRMFMVAAVSIGVFTHLLLDEIYSVEWDGRPRLKSSFGTAMKFVGKDWWPNFTCYAKLIVLTFIVINDPSVVHQLYAGQGEMVAKNIGQGVKDRLANVMPARNVNAQPGTMVQPATQVSTTSPTYLNGGPAATAANGSYATPTAMQRPAPAATIWPSRQANASYPDNLAAQPAAASMPNNYAPQPAAYSAPNRSYPSNTASPTRDDNRPPSGQRFW